LLQSGEPCNLIGRNIVWLILRILDDFFRKKVDVDLPRTTIVSPGKFGCIRSYDVRVHSEQTDKHSSLYKEIEMIVHSYIRLLLHHYSWLSLDKHNSIHRATYLELPERVWILREIFSSVAIVHWSVSNTVRLSSEVSMNQRSWVKIECNWLQKKFLSIIEEKCKWLAIDTYCKYSSSITTMFVFLSHRYGIDDRFQLLSINIKCADCSKPNRKWAQEPEWHLRSE
jgi:hypothetical protein